MDMKMKRRMTMTETAKEMGTEGQQAMTKRSPRRTNAIFAREVFCSQVSVEPTAKIKQLQAGDRKPPQ
jgi:hypothetical protein